MREQRELDTDGVCPHSVRLATTDGVRHVFTANIRQYLGWRSGAPACGGFFPIRDRRSLGGVISIAYPTKPSVSVVLLDSVLAESVPWVIAVSVSCAQISTSLRVLKVLLITCPRRRTRARHWYCHVERSLP